MGFIARARQGRKWLTSCFTAAAMLVTPLGAEEGPAPVMAAPAAPALPAPALADRVPVIADSGGPAAVVCTGMLTPENVRELTGFGNVDDVTLASALIREMNGRNGTPLAVLAILEASDIVGIDLELLLIKALLESRLGVFDVPIGVDGAARGLYQFMPATWLKLFHDYGAQYQNGRYADLARDITVDSKFNASIADEDKKTAILALRSDERMAAFIKAMDIRNLERAQLRRMLRREPKPVDYYMLHLLGAPRATTFYNRLSRKPNGTATATFAREARYNRGVFYNNRGRARTYRQVYNHLSTLMETYTNLIQRAAAEGTAATAGCVPVLTFGQEPPPAKEIPPPRPVPRPPPEEMEKIRARAIAKGFVEAARVTPAPEGYRPFTRLFAPHPA